MIKKIGIFLLAFSFCIMLFPLPATSQPISFNPSELYVTGEMGDLEIVQIVVTNSENTSIDMTIKYIGDTEVFIPNSAIQIPANAQKSITLGFVLNDDEIGWIEYTAGSTTISQLVVIKISKVTPSLMVFPENPASGSSLAFMITSGDILDAHGFLFCSETGNIYPIEITNGMGMIKLGENETGDAIARITGDGLNPLFANFTINDDGNSNNDNNNNPDLASVFSIDGPNSVFFGDQKDITILDGISPVEFVSVLVSKPSGNSYEAATNSFGKMSTQFTEVGAWQFSVMSGDKIVNKDTECNKRVEDLFLQTNNPLKNSDVVVDVFNDALIRVTKPDMSTITGVEHNGLFTFTPSLVGSYTVKAESEESTGSINIDVTSTPKIIVTDIGGNNIIGDSKMGDVFYVRLVDYDNTPLDIDTTITAQQLSDPYGLPTNIEIFESFGTWTPLTLGSYTLKFSGKGFYNEVQTTISISESSSFFALNWWYFAIIIIFAIIVIAVMLTRAPPEFWKKKLMGWKEGRKERKKKDRGIQPPV